MLKKIRPCALGFTLLASFALVAGCDRVRALADKIKNSAGAKPASAETTGSSTAKGTYSSDQVTSIDSSNYESFVSQKNKLVIIDFYADWCGPCRMMGPALEKAAEANPGVVFVGKVNVDQAGKLAAEHQVSGIPDVRIFKDGQQVERFVGFPGEETVMEKISALAKGISPVAPPPRTKRTADDPEIQRMPKNWMPPGIQKR